ncbi:MAG: NADH-quinone oxidoreductase subunit NuoH [Armatimonadetes bacterium]|nr:NADH-quinone oxidoreductase subunit NuoH [Armatimonadota bacterium]MDW8121559.1 NADH-quinone oxidoreductase subunit NuoH [Armatimonadota bacterium]
MAEEVFWGILKFVIVLTCVFLSIPFVILAERRFLGFMQDRYGPNRVGPGGLLQSFADVVKLLFKEEIIPAGADKALYLLAPALVLVPALCTFVVIPFGPNAQPVDLGIGVLYILGLASLGVYGIVLAGWSSNSKYAFLGALRSSAQMISYELAVGLAIVVVVMMTGSLRLGEIVNEQAGPLRFWWAGQLVEVPFLPNWLALKPLAWPALLIFLVGGFAETNRAPFDLPEAETELVAGYHTEYTGMKFAMFFLAEYANVLTVSAMTVTLFFGGWHGPLLPPLVWFLLKMSLVVFLFMWARATLPRIRYDRLMQLGWTALLPVGLANVVALAFYHILKVGYGTI